MRSSFSVNADPSQESGDRARIAPRKMGSIAKFFTIEQVSELLVVSTKTVGRWIKKELLVAHRFGGLVRIAEPDLRAFLAQHRDD